MTKVAANVLTLISARLYDALCRVQYVLFYKSETDEMADRGLATASVGFRLASVCLLDTNRRSWTVTSVHFHITLSFYG